MSTPSLITPRPLTSPLCPPAFTWARHCVDGVNLQPPAVRARDRARDLAVRLEGLERVLKDLGQDILSHYEEVERLEQVRHFMLAELEREERRAVALERRSSRCRSCFCA